jgi:hypothetical protein
MWSHIRDIRLSARRRMFCSTGRRLLRNRARIFFLLPMSLHGILLPLAGPRSVSRRRNVFLRIHFLLAAAAAMRWDITFNGLRQLDSTGSKTIKSLSDATAYVRGAAMICSITNLFLSPDDIKTRLYALDKC